MPPAASRYYESRVKGRLQTWNSLLGIECEFCRTWSLRLAGAGLFDHLGDFVQAFGRRVDAGDIEQRRDGVAVRSIEERLDEVFERRALCSLSGQHRDIDVTCAVLLMLDMTFPFENSQE